MKAAFALALLVGLGALGWWFSRSPQPQATDPASDVELEPAPVSRPTREAIYEGPQEILPEPTQEPSPWIERNNAGVRALEGGDLDAALAHFEACHSGEPENAVFRRNLAECLARLARQDAESGEMERALARLERAVELVPEREDLAAWLARWRRVANSEEGFWVDRSEHFALSYDGSRDELLWNSSEILNVLEAAYLEFGESFGRFPVEAGRDRIRVVLYRREEFRDVTGLGHWAGGVFDGTVRVPLEDLGKERSVLERVLRHELMHAFVAECGGTSVPGWLNEGLAQHIEGNPTEHRARVVRAAERLEGAELFSLKTMQTSFAGWKDENAIQRAYAQALCFTDWVARTFGERVLFELVLALGRGEELGPSFRARTGLELRAAEEQFAGDLSLGR